METNQRQAKCEFNSFSWRQPNIATVVPHRDGGNKPCCFRQKISAGSWFDEPDGRGLPADCKLSCDSVSCAEDARGEQSRAKLNKQDKRPVGMRKWWAHTSARSRNWMGRMHSRHFLPKKDGGWLQRDVTSFKWRIKQQRRFILPIKESFWRIVFPPAKSHCRSSGGGVFCTKQARIRRLKHDISSFPASSWGLFRQSFLQARFFQRFYRVSDQLIACSDRKWIEC